MYFFLIILIGSYQYVLITGVPIKNFILGASFGSTDIRDLQAQDSILLWQETHLRQNLPLVGYNRTEFTIETRIMQHGNNLSLAISNYRQLAADPDLIAFMIPFPIEFAVPIYQQVVASSGKVFFTVPVQPSMRENPMYFSFFPTQSQLISTSLNSLRFVGVQNVLILRTTEADAVVLCEDAMGPELTDKGVKATHLFVVQAQSLNQSHAATHNLTETIRQIKSLSNELDDFEAVIMCSSNPSTQIMINAFSDWCPRALITLPQLQSPSTLLSTMPATFVSGPLIWSPSLPYPGDPVFGNPQTFSSEFSQRFGVDPFASAAGTAAMLVVLEEGLRQSYRYTRAADPSSEDLAFSLYRIDVETVFGRVRFNSYGENIVERPFLQYFPDYSSRFSNHTNLTFSQPMGYLGFLPDQQPRNNLWDFDQLEQHVVYPPRLQTATFVYPIPEVSDRTKTTGWFMYGSEIAVIVLDCIGIVISLGWGLFVLLMRTRDAIRCAGPGFLYAMIFGTITMYLAVFTWLLYVNDSTCMALPWLVISGFSIYFGAILIKLYRIWRITDAANNMRKYSVPLPQLTSFWVIILLPPAILLIVMTAVAPLTAEIHVPDPLRPSQSFYYCDASRDSQVFIGLLGAYCVLLFLAAIVFIKLTWKIDRVVLNESIWLAFSVWTLMLCAIIGVIVIASSAIGRETEFVVRSLAYILGIAFSLCIFFIPKISYIRSGKYLSNISSSSTIVRFGIQSSSSNISD